MKKELIRLLRVLEDTVPKYEMKKNRIIRSDSEMSPECEAFFNHLMSFDSITVKPNMFGLDCIEDTDIPVFRSIASPPYIDTRYGRIILPVRIHFL